MSAVGPSASPASQTRPRRVPIRPIGGIILNYLVSPAPQPNRPSGRWRPAPIGRNVGWATGLEPLDTRGDIERLRAGWRVLTSQARWIGQNAPVSGGKRAGARQKKGFRPVLLVLAVGITLCVVAWGYLVYAAIDFGSTARHDNDSSAWVYLAVAAVGAVACLFLGFMLLARFTRALGLSSGPEPKPKRDPAAPKGGKRAAR